MLPIFSKPVDQITAEDVSALVANKWPEGDTVEFKEALPSKKAGGDPWITGANSISDYARNEILAGVVAFANAHGGMVILGIAETTDKLPRAAAVNPLPRCAELAERLLDQARECIEPKLPVLSVRGVEMDKKGNGVVVFRVPQSRLAPHRLEPTRHCYYRRAASSEKMTMREIQDLTLRLERGLEAIERRFIKQREAFEKWVTAGGIGSDGVPAFGIKSTAIPMSADLNVERVYQRPEYLPAVRPFAAKVEKSGVELLVPNIPVRERPILRGTLREYDDRHLPVYHLPVYQELHCDGLIEIAMKRALTEGDPLLVPLHWIMGVAVNTMVCAHRFRTAAGAPDVEYGLELEVMTVNGEMPLAGFSGRPLVDALPPPPLSPNPLILPRMSIGSPDEFQRLINIILTDICDAASVRRTESEPEPDPELIVDFADALEEILS